MKTSRTDTETEEPTTPRFNTDALPASTDAESAPSGGGASRRFKISGLHVNQATADLPDEQRSLVRRLHAHCCEQDMILSEIGEKLGYDATVLHKVLHGKYEGSLPKVCESIARYFRLQDERDQGRKLAFIETDQTRRIWQFCRMALEVQRVGFIFGDTQIGKTEPLKAYAKAHNHGETIYCEIPTGGALINFLRSLARALRISPDTNESVLRASIFAAVDDRMLLIVDEVHRAIPSITSIRPVRCIEFLRELHDHTRCGLILCATNVFREVLEQKRGPVAGILKQMHRRRFGTLQLPEVPSDRERRLVCARPARGIVHLRGGVFHGPAARGWTGREARWIPSSGRSSASDPNSCSQRVRPRPCGRSARSSGAGSLRWGVRPSWSVPCWTWRHSSPPGADLLPTRSPI